LQFNPRITLGSKKIYLTLGYCFTKKFCPELDGAVLGLFLNTNVAEDATARSSIGAPEVVWRVIKHTRIILKLAKF